MSLSRISLIAFSGKNGEWDNWEPGEVAGAGRSTGSSHPHSPSWPQTTQAAPALAAELLSSTWPSKPGQMDLVSGHDDGPDVKC